MNKYPSLIVLMLYGVACMSIGAAIVYFGEQYDKSFSLPSSVVGVGTVPAPTFNFDDLLDAIEWVESKGNPWAVGDDGAAVGAYQIHKIYVDDVNRIRRAMVWGDTYGCLYTYRDRENKQRSREMVTIFFKHYRGTFEEMARKHNGGPNGHKKESTKAYWEKVKARMGDQYLMVKEIR